MASVIIGRFAVDDWKIGVLWQAITRIRVSSGLPGRVRLGAAPLADDIVAVTPGSLVDLLQGLEKRASLQRVIGIPVAQESPRRLALAHLPPIVYQFMAMSKRSSADALAMRIRFGCSGAGTISLAPGFKLVRRTCAMSTRRTGVTALPCAAGRLACIAGGDAARRFRGCRGGSFAAGVCCSAWFARQLAQGSRIGLDEMAE